VICQKFAEKAQEDNFLTHTVYDLFFVLLTYTVTFAKLVVVRHCHSVTALLVLRAMRCVDVMSSRASCPRASADDVPKRYTAQPGPSGLSASCRSI